MFKTNLNMELNEYQEKAMLTCLPTCDNIPYMLFNLQGEVGELSSKVAKAIRKNQITVDGLINANGIYHRNQANWNISGNEKDELIEAIKGEAGDVLWQLSGLCSVLSLSMDEVAQYNLDKLASRQQRGVIDGDGDNR